MDKDYIAEMARFFSDGASHALLNVDGFEELDDKSKSFCICLAACVMACKFFGNLDEVIKK